MSPRTSRLTAKKLLNNLKMQDLLKSVKQARI